MLDDVNKAKIVITNYHSFKLRERVELSKGGRQLLEPALPKPDGWNCSATRTNTATRWAGRAPC